MIYAYIKEPNKEAEQISFIGESDMNLFAQKYLGKERGVLVLNEHLQAVCDKTVLCDKTAPANMFIECLDGSVINARGNLLFTCIDAKKIGEKAVIISDESFKEEFEKLKTRQDELCQKWFMEDGF